MSREDCIEWYSGKDYKTPAKSSCIGCPYHDDSFWLDMKNNRPDEFAAAVIFDKRMRDNDHKIKNYMHRSCKNLDEDVFHVKREEDQLDLLYHSGLDGWKAKIKETKDKYPKPSS